MLRHNVCNLHTSAQCPRAIEDACNGHRRRVDPPCRARGSRSLIAGLFMRRLFICGVLVALVLVAAGCKFVVTPAAPSNWFFLNEGATGSGYYVNGPGTPPAGRGSALLTIDGTGREAIASAQFSGLALSAINPLRYSTYQAFSAAAASEAPTLAF